MTYNENEINQISEKDYEFMQHVICNMCNWKGYVSADIERCPQCKKIGYLMDIEDQA